MKTIEKGRRAGYETVTTRAPAQTLSYLKYDVLKKFRGSSLTEMFNDMASAFLTEHPWERGFPWKETMALSRRHVYQEETFAPDGKTVIVSKTRTEATGWVQVNTLLRPDLVRRIESLAQIHTTNRSIVLYTMMYWWAWFKFPPPEIVERRRREREARTEQWRKDMAKATPQAVEQAGADVAAEVIKHVKKGVPSS